MYTITTGIHDLTKPGASSHRVEEVKRHEHFKEEEKFNDIALMRVRDKFQFNDKVQPIKLATDDIPDDTTVEFTGWGRVSSVSFCSFGHLVDEFLFNKIY